MNQNKEHLESIKCEQKSRSKIICFADVKNSEYCVG